jgi:hypothetical protein
VPVVIGNNKKGKEITSCILQETENTICQQEQTTRLGNKQKKFLETLNELYGTSKENLEKGNYDTNKLADVSIEDLKKKLGGDFNSSTFYDNLKKLEERELIIRVSSLYIKPQE